MNSIPTPEPSPFPGSCPFCACGTLLHSASVGENFSLWIFTIEVVKAPLGGGAPKQVIGERPVSPKGQLLGSARQGWKHHWRVYMISHLRVIVLTSGDRHILCRVSWVRTRTPHGGCCPFHGRKTGKGGSDMTNQNSKWIRASNPPGPLMCGCHCDPKVPGLRPRVRDTKKSRRAKSWVLEVEINGKVTHIRLGPYPAVNLEEVRRRARAALDEIAAGREPPGRRCVPTFREVAEQMIAERSALAKRRGESTPKSWGS